MTTCSSSTKSLTSSTSAPNAAPGKHIVAYLKACRLARRQNVANLTHPFHGYSGLEDLTLKHGRLWPWVAPARKSWRGLLGHCFENAGKLALVGESLIYCEGWADSGLGIPLHHAWCVDPQGRVVDPTWQKYKGVTPAYFGVAIHRKYLADLILQTKTWSGVLYVAEFDFPLLRDPVADWKHPLNNRP